MNDDPLRAALVAAAQAGVDEQRALLAVVAGRDVRIDPDELNGAIRRAQLLLATGGDPRRALDPQGRAVTAVAADLDDPSRRKALAAGLAALEPVVTDIPSLRGVLDELRDDPDLAWRAFATATVADALDEDED